MRIQGVWSMHRFKWSDCPPSLTSGWLLQASPWCKPKQSWMGPRAMVTLDTFYVVQRVLDHFTQRLDLVLKSSISCLEVGCMSLMVPKHEMTAHIRPNVSSDGQHNPSLDARFAITSTLMSNRTSASLRVLTSVDVRYRSNCLQVCWARAVGLMSSPARDAIKSAMTAEKPSLWASDHGPPETALVIIVASTHLNNNMSIRIWRPLSSWAIRWKACDTIEGLIHWCSKRSSHDGFFDEQMPRWWWSYHNNSSKPATQLLGYQSMFWCPSRARPA